MSALTSAAARSWSIVSSYGNAASISACHGRVRREGVALRASARAAYSASSSSARSSTALRTRCLARSHSVPPSLRQRRPLAAGVARDPVDLLDRHEDPVAAGERQLEVVALLARRRRAGASARSGRRRGRCGRRGRPASAARGCRAARPGGAPAGRRTRTVPNSSRSVTKASPSGPPAKPPLRLRSTSAIAPGGGASPTPARRPRPGGRPRRGARRGAAPGRRRGRSGRRPPASASTASASRPARPGGRTGSRQPNRSPDDSAPRAIATSSGGSDSQVSSSVREPTSRLFQSRGGR